VLQAANRIKREQLFVALTQVMVLPVSYLALKMGAGPTVPLIIAVVLQFISIIIDVQVVRFELKKDMHFYLMMLLRLYGTCIISYFVTYWIMTLMPSSFIRLVIVTLTSIIICSALMYVIGFDRDERQLIIRLINKAINREKR
jgi:hypothetical protein